MNWATALSVRQKSFFFSIVDLELGHLEAMNISGVTIKPTKILNALRRRRIRRIVAVSMQTTHKDKVVRQAREQRELEKAFQASDIDVAYPDIWGSS